MCYALDNSRQYLHLSLLRSIQNNLSMCTMWTNLESLSSYKLTQPRMITLQPNGHTAATQLSTLSHIVTAALPRPRPSSTLFPISVCTDTFNLLTSTHYSSDTRLAPYPRTENESPSSQCDRSQCWGYVECDGLYYLKIKKPHTVVTNQSYSDSFEIMLVSYPQWDIIN